MIPPKASPKKAWGGEAAQQALQSQDKNHPISTKRFAPTGCRSAPRRASQSLLAMSVLPDSAKSPPNGVRSACSPIFATMTFMPKQALAGISFTALLAAPFVSAPAQAQSACPTGVSWADLVALGSTGCILGDKLYSNFSGNLSAGDFALTIQPGNQFSLQGSSLALTPGAYNYSYSVAVVAPSPDLLFGYQSQISTSNIGVNNATSTLATPNAVNSPSNSDIVNSAVTPLDPVFFNANQTTTAFSGNINVTDGVVDTFTNRLAQITPQSNSVPGPLPILGAAAAFASVRKLRKFSSLVKQG